MIKLALLITFYSTLILASNSPIILKTLRPTKTSNLELGHLIAEIISVKSGKALASISGKIGDCSDCIRGTSFDGQLGIRLEGSTFESLKMVRKQSAKIKLIACPQNQIVQTPDMACLFTFNNDPLKIVFHLTK